MTHNADASSDYTVLIVDDDKFSHTMTEDTVSEHYKTLSAFNGEDGIRLAQTEHPQIILLDIEMPGMNGYDVCKILKADPATANIPVVFVSGKSEVEDKLKGYEVGADDFLLKPVEPIELLSKLKVITNAQLFEADMKIQIQQATQIAITAMSAGSDMGKVVKFIRATNGIQDLAAFSTEFFKITNELNLNCCLLVTFPDEEPLITSSQGEISSVEREVIIKLHEKGDRIFDFAGRRTQINYPHISVLIKNMPVDDRERYGAIKDLLPPMLEAADIRIRNLHTLRLFIEQASSLASSFKIADNMLSTISSTLGEHHQKMLDCMNILLNDLALKLPNMGLEDDQEAYLITRVDQTVTEAITLSDASSGVSESFTSIIKMFDALTHRQQKILDDFSLGFQQYDSKDDDELF